MSFINWKHTHISETPFENLNQSIDWTKKFLDRYFKLISLKWIDFIDEIWWASKDFINESIYNILSFFYKFDNNNFKKTNWVNIIVDSNYNNLKNIQINIDKYTQEKLIILIEKFDEWDTILKSLRVLSAQNIRIEKLLKMNWIEETIDNTKEQVFELTA